MTANDNWHMCPGTGCGCHATGAISPFSAWPLPLAFPPPPPRCPATTRHVRCYSTGISGLQCHYEPGHDGDHAAYAGPGEGDIFWPQENEPLKPDTGQISATDHAMMAKVTGGGIRNRDLKADFNDE